MKVKKICLLLDEPKIMKWVALALQKAVSENNISIPLVIIKKVHVKDYDLSFQKKFIQKIITLIRDIIGWQIELAERISINNLSLFNKSEIYYSSAIKSGKHGTALPEETIKKIKTKKIDLVFRRGFGILQGEILRCTPAGVLSYHTGDLRKYRGFSSTLEAYLHNEKYINISVQKLNEGLDKGSLFYEERADIRNCHSYEEVAKLISKLLIPTFSKSIEKINSPGFKIIKLSSFGKHYGIPRIRDFPILCIRYFFTEIKRKFISTQAKKTRVCFICSSRKGRVEKIEVILKDEYAEVVRCSNCGMLYNNSLDFVESEVKDVYSDEDYGHYKLKDIKEREENRAVLKKYKIGLIKKFLRESSNKTFLDIGCSTGDLLQLAQKEGFRVFGVEVSENACRIAREKGFPLKMFHGELTCAGYPDDFFDVINIDAVLVDIKNPNIFMKEVRRILKPDGYLFIGDNENSHLLLENFIYKLFFHKIKEYKYWLNFFTLASFTQFMKKQKFNIVSLKTLCYSDKIFQDYMPSALKRNKLIKISLLVLRFTKIDRFAGFYRLFEAVLTK
ncbi:hypothetical protein A3D77_04405 [Candidatus Gottesmanbacteria bacterium RIFCSPHIGHO2_02_FULL_39_11]|uniref:Formyl transferase N-terminal domain-containing protein n=1 Tax=Candidatus Gottesmanbacteria bacterium RIFCSPHIGHO2_02_FULL_39_11 TaxID=1798382 RepID=A0A1F5ZJR3_9BACT|nr:MAG: hypothetical protein A3D77_04405 [Candidatus Gottesmanbacteria bacterium RIFCSPHIGHO2_02_FULL_39_11]